MQEFLHFTGRQATGKCVIYITPESKAIVISHNDLREGQPEGVGRMDSADGPDAGGAGFGGVGAGGWLGGCTTPVASGAGLPGLVSKGRCLFTA